MKLSVDRNSFLKTLAHAQSVVERRTTVPILAHVLIQAKDDTLTITATDLDLSYTETIAAAVNTPGSFTVPAHMLYDIVRKLPHSQPLVLSLTDANSQLLVTSGPSEFVLPTLTSDDFPVLQQDSLPYNFRLSAVTLRALIDATRFAMATEETRYYLNGLYWHTSDSPTRLHVVATDGHRLSRSETDLPDGAMGMPGVILSRKTVIELRKVLEEVDEDVEVGLSDVQMRFSFARTTLISRLIDGTFPDYQRVIPEHNDRLLTVSRAAFAEAVDRVAIITSERSRAIKLSLSHNSLILSAVSSENGSAKEEVNVTYNNDSMEIGFNAKYLLDITSHLQGEEAEFLLSDAAAPVLIRDRGYAHNLFVLMPMRV